MKLLDKKTTVDLIKLLTFLVVTSLATGVLIVTIGNIDFKPSHTYEAVFSDATGVNKGDDVRIAGVKVGSVKSVQIQNRTQALVSFSVQDTTPLTQATHATIKFRNLVGQRYISLDERVGSSAPLATGATIPLTHTTPALDLTVLFNGFKPLFQALSPDDLNKLSYEVVQTFQGEGGTLQDLLAHTASLTSTLADRDQVISSLITNLNEVLDHLGDRDKQLSSLIINFKDLVHGLKGDRKPILDSLQQISALSVQTASLVEGATSPLETDIKQLDTFSANLDKGKAEIDRVLQVAPIKLTKVGRTATYGSFFNFYLCSLKGNIRLPGSFSIPITYNTDAPRCDLG